MPDPNRIYVDACVYLAYVNLEADKMSDIDAVFAEAQRGQIELWTSVVTITEVAFGKAEQDGKLPDPSVLARIDSLWTPPAPSRLVEFYDEIARDARELIRLALPDDRKPLKPMDAIHIATARRWELGTVYTFDESMMDWGPTLGLRIELPKPIAPHLPWEGVSPSGPTEPPLPAAQYPDAPSD